MIQNLKLMKIVWSMARPCIANGPWTLVNKKDDEVEVFDAIFFGPLSMAFDFLSNF